MLLPVAATPEGVVEGAGLVEAACERDERMRIVGGIIVDASVIVEAEHTAAGVGRCRVVVGSD